MTYDRVTVESNNVLQEIYWVMAPGDTYMIHDAETIRWGPDPGLSAAWAAQKFALDEVKKFYREDYAKRTFQGQTLHSQSVVDCTRAVYEATEAALQKEESEEEDPTVDAVQKGLKIAKTVRCRDAWKRAGEAARLERVQGQPGQGLPPVRNPWPDRVAALADQADTGIDIWKAINKVSLACTWLPRC